MNRVSATLALIALLAGGVAAAQTPPASSPRPPPSTMPPTSEDPGATTAPSPPQAPNSTTDKKAQLKDCITQQRANDPQMSEHDAKKVCKAAVNGSPRN